ncbi:MAG: transcriptional regulator [Planctomycetaceae bacterium]|nr:transcriptional regulator [Planctomycetaceae bacterium]
MKTASGIRAGSETSHLVERDGHLGHIALHAIRAGVFAAILWLIRDQHVAYELRQVSLREDPVTTGRLQKFFPDAKSIGPSSHTGARTVLDSQQQPLGYFVQTSPTSDQIVGYLGPTNTLLAFDTENRVVGIEILRSADTVEHVRDVVNDDVFMTVLAGRSWEEARHTAGVDAVSGATLTSLAILEGIALRLGGATPSLRFPHEIDLAEATTFFPEAFELVSDESSPAILDVHDDRGTTLGSVFRTSPATDTEMGYQGPTDTLIALDRDGRVKGIRVRRSYDNEPYVGYVRDDSYFLERFNDLTLAELSKLDPAAAAEIEGVSGATMTSRAMAYGLPKAARQALRPSQGCSRRIVWSLRDIGTCCVLGTALLMAFTRLRGSRWVRVGFHVVLVLYFGFLNGDMLSQALLVGWAQSGVPWQLAPGLALLTAAALIMPAVSKKNLYCQQVCPFGAAQQLVRNRLPWKARLPRVVVRSLKCVPGLLLLLVILTGMLHWQLNLAGIEPFDAFIFWIAGAATLSVALGGLVASAFVPMAYCRFGCPTGATLNYLRYNAKSNRCSRRDFGAMGLLMVALALRFWA